MWGKMFGNYKLGNEVVPMEDSGMLSPSLPVEKTRMASVSTGTEQRNTIYNRKASTMSLANNSRTVSESSSSKNRAFSISSRRSSKNSIRSWFRSANPDTDANVPAMPTMDRKFSQFSMFSSHNPDSESLNGSPTASPTASRRPSYVPRNAASSFLRTTTPLSSEEKAEVSRRASVAEQLPTPSIVLKSRSVSSPSPARTNKPAPLLFTAPAAHGMHSMEGVCDIDDSELISPRGTTFAAPHSPADTIMEDPIEHQVDSAKASPELNPTKNESTVAVVELAC